MDFVDGKIEISAPLESFIWMYAKYKQGIANIKPNIIPGSTKVIL